MNVINSFVNRKSGVASSRDDLRFYSSFFIGIINMLRV
ncbi:hypothetical protein CWATWH0402_518 [Crocosphaera watsonii WH 0402]|uniref:Uncharacterized protein n=1 Tax=Crocosphaera watsonii WH 0402 TaxID=1284629 RepID=T2JXK3_CROWT|nr:hypothetical protein CWATWH0402_518 [Crocosphaera watsonii WH 0402]